MKNGLKISTNSQSAGCGPPMYTIDLNQKISVKSMLSPCQLVQHHPLGKITTTFLLLNAFFKTNTELKSETSFHKYFTINQLCQENNQ